MKRLLIAAALLILGCSVASAQQKGDKYFGGTAGFAIQAGDGVGAALGIQPEFGEFVADNWRLGVSVSYTLNGLHMFTLAPNFAYYARLCDGLYYTPGLEAGLVVAASGGVYPGVGVTLHMFSLEFRPTEHFGFTANLASLNFVAIANAGSALSFNLGVNPTVGFKYYF